MLTETKVLDISPLPRAVLQGKDAIELQGGDLVLYTVSLGYLVQDTLDLEKLIYALRLTLSYFPLMCGSVLRPCSPDQPWLVRLLDQPIPLEVMHTSGSEMVPREGVMQPQWLWCSSIDEASMCRGKETHRLISMRFTFLDDKGWTILAINYSHLIADGEHVAHFWRFLSEAYIKGSISAPPPVYDRPPVLGKRIEDVKDVSIQAYFQKFLVKHPPPHFNTANITWLRVILSDNQLASLKKGVMSTTTQDFVSTQDCLIGAIAVALSGRCSESGLALPPIHRIRHAKNIRSLPAFANCGMNCLITAESEPAETVAGIAKALRDSHTISMQPDILEIYRTFWADEVSKAAWNNELPSTAFPADSIYVNSLNKLGFLDSHFGCPGKVSFLYSFYPLLRCLLVFRRNPVLPQIGDDGEREGMQWEPGVECHLAMRCDDVNSFMETLKSVLTEYGVQDVVNVRHETLPL